MRNFIRLLANATFAPVTYCFMVLFVTLTLYEVFSKLFDAGSQIMVTP